MNLPKRISFTILACILVATSALPQSPQNDSDAKSDSVIASVLHSIIQADSVMKARIVENQIIHLDSLLHLTTLSEADYNLAAAELGVDIATIKAVVEVETGNNKMGFSERGVPIINFDRKVFYSRLRKNNISVEKHSHSKAFESLNIKKYGSINAAHWALLNSAREIDAAIANESTFWGMFQIGGFNWHKCGVESIEEFVLKMSQSEQSQLQLFVNFILSDKRMINALQNKNWQRFATLYNGPNYARRGYHKKLASAYSKYAKYYANP